MQHLTWQDQASAIDETGGVTNPRAGVRYLMVLPVPARRIDNGRFAIESAFAEHLRLLKPMLGPLAGEMVLACPELDGASAQSLASFAVVDEKAEGIRFVPMFASSLGRLGYFKKLPGIVGRLREEVRASVVVHTGTSTLYRPFEIVSLVLAWWYRKVSISVTDIDHRNSARMNLQTGRWSYREYLTTRLFHYGYSHLQHLWVARYASLVLFKGRKLASDYGRGHPNVKFFLDSAFLEKNIITKEALETKLQRLKSPGSVVEIAYYGRLVAYKGIDHMLQAVAAARAAGLRDFRFNVLGSGEEKQNLQALTEALGLNDCVVFHEAMPYGEDLFRKLNGFDILLAAPLSEDTPRSALDASASGQAILAYATYYYTELQELGAGVVTVPWLDTAALAQRLKELCSDRAALVRLMRRAEAFARENTQEIWLDRRIAWTKSAIAEKSA